MILECAESGVIMFYLMKGCHNIMWLICSPCTVQVVVVSLGLDVDGL